MKTLLSVVVSILLTVTTLLIGGVTVQYGWNNFIAPSLVIPTISLPLAVGIDLTITYITGYSRPLEFEVEISKYEGLAKVVASWSSAMYTSIMTLLFMWIITLFM